MSLRVGFTTAPSNSTESSTESNVPPPESFSIFKLMEELFASYKEALRTAPIMTKSITSATISILGEILGSYIICKQKKEPFTLKFSRLQSFGLYGLLITGPLLHWWYGILERTVRRLNLSGYTKTIAKLLIDRLLFGPPMVLLTVIFLQFFQHFDIQLTISYMHSSYWPVLVMNEKVWTIAQAVNFELVPVQYQVLFVNAVAIGYNTLLSIAS